MNITKRDVSKKCDAKYLVIHNHHRIHLRILKKCAIIPV